MAYFIKYQPESAYDRGIFVPYATQVEAERQIANDLLNAGVGDRLDGIVSADYPSEGRAPLYNPATDTYDAEHPMVQARWLHKHETVADADKVVKLAEKHLADLQRERVTAQAERDLAVHRVTMAFAKGGGWAGLTAEEKKLAEHIGLVPEGSIPGNAYTVVSGGTATAGAIALAAATAKTVIGIAAGSANAPSLVEYAISFDGVTASAVPVLVEWVSGTNATNGPGTNSTSMTPKQIRGVTAASQATAAYNWTSEPTVLEVFKKRLLTPNGGLLLIQMPMGREPTGQVAASTQFKFQGLRLTAPAVVNVHVDVEYEE